MELGLAEAAGTVVFLLVIGFILNKLAITERIASIDGTVLRWSLWLPWTAFRVIYTLTLVLGCMKLGAAALEALAV